MAPSASTRSRHRRRCPALLFLVLAALARNRHGADAFVVNNKQRTFLAARAGPAATSSPPSRLRYMDEGRDSGWSPDNNNNGNNERNADGEVENRCQSVRRAGVAGVSVSDAGFLMLLSTSYNNANSNSDNDSNNDGVENEAATTSPTGVVLPLRVTSPPEDTSVASSPEALTLIQLLTGIDMAGAVMQPAALQHLVALYCSKDDEEYEDDEDDDEDDGINFVEDELGLLTSGGAGGMSSVDARAAVRDFISQSLRENAMPGAEFRDADAYARARVQFPHMTLDGVRIEAAEFIGEVLDKAADKDTKADVNNAGAQGNKGTSQVRPLPLKFVLEVTVQGTQQNDGQGDDVRLDVPLYSEITSIKYSALTDTVRDAMDLSESILSELCLTHDLDGSAAFLSLALALRYKSPVVFDSEVLDLMVGVQAQQDAEQAERAEQGGPGGQDAAGGGTVCIFVAGDDATGDDLNSVISRTLPQWSSVSDLQSTSQRVVDNIERSFEVHKLQGALRIATERGDEQAAEKIRAELERLDSFDELPTTSSTEEDVKGRGGGATAAKEQHASAPFAPEAPSRTAFGTTRLSVYVSNARPAVPAASKEEDLEKTYRVIMDHIAQTDFAAETRLSVAYGRRARTKEEDLEKTYLVIMEHIAEMDFAGGEEAE